MGTPWTNENWLNQLDRTSRLPNGATLGTMTKMAILGAAFLKSMSTKNAKNSFGTLIDLARAEPVTMEKHVRSPQPNSIDHLKSEHEALEEDHPQGLRHARISQNNKTLTRRKHLGG
jgi:hypothetical protein